MIKLKIISTAAMLLLPSNIFMSTCIGSNDDFLCEKHKKKPLLKFHKRERSKSLPGSLHSNNTHDNKSEKKLGNSLPLDTPIQAIEKEESHIQVKSETLFKFLLKASRGVDHPKHFLGVVL
jgi:hypothetical protein